MSDNDSNPELILAEDTVLARHAGIVTSEIEGETVMMDANFEKYFGIKKVGTRIWGLLENERTLAELCDTLCSEFDVTPERCREDVVPFLEQLHERGMLKAG